MSFTLRSEDLLTHSPCSPHSRTEGLLNIPLQTTRAEVDLQHFANTKQEK